MSERDILRRVERMGQGVEHLEMQLFLGDAPPLLKRLAVGHGETGEKITAVAVNGLPQAHQTGLAVRQRWMGMRRRLGQQRAKGRDISADEGCGKRDPRRTEARHAFATSSARGGGEIVRANDGAAGRERRSRVERVNEPAAARRATESERFV